MRNVYIWNVSCTFSSLAPSRAYFLDAEVSLTSQCSRISAECVVGVSILRKLSACCGAVPFSGHLRDVVTLIYRSVPCPSPRPRTFRSGKCEIENVSRRSTSACRQVRAAQWISRVWSVDSPTNSLSRQFVTEHQITLLALVTCISTVYAENGRPISPWPKQWQRQL